MPARKYTAALGWGLLSMTQKPGPVRWTLKMLAPMTAAVRAARASHFPRSTPQQARKMTVIAADAHNPKAKYSRKKKRKKTTGNNPPNRQPEKRSGCGFSNGKVSSTAAVNRKTVRTSFINCEDHRSMEGHEATSRATILAAICPS